MKNYWWLNINPRLINFKDLDNGDFFTYYALNEDGSERKIYSNFVEAKKDEVVIIYENGANGKILGICIVEKEIENNVICFKKIENLVEYIPRVEIENNRDLVNMEAFRNQEGTFFKISIPEFKALYNIIRDWNPRVVYTKNSVYSKEIFLKEVYFEEADYDELRDLIETRKNVILQGPPGVGKTYIAKRMAYSILGEKSDGNILNIQFHPNYSCDEFIEGFRPDDIGIYKYREGCFKEFCNSARNDRDNKYFLIIDEINRGDIIKIFGDTFMLLEPDKRGKENFVILPASKEKFYIPDNLYIIGTMNIFDENQNISDYAVRRRFCFYNIKNIFNNRDFIEKTKEIPMVYKAVQKIIEINKELDEYKQIGHCYFCNVKNEKELIKTIKYNLIPLIKEYFKNDKNKQEKIIKKLDEIII